ncbi:MAG: YabP/YqfC family sporulation protein [Clostridia bacterium]|nr:YabP/YqfC family sporulation protein [Clostridia bacterium]MBR3681076.1 YabP/YqfC family sporulation protein [Clostridia bacterium]
MTKAKRRMSLAALSPTLAAGLSLEMKKSRLGAVMLVSGVISVTELSGEEITLLSHSGRLFIFGERLTVTALESRTLAVYGKIKGVEMSYGRRE